MAIIEVQVDDGLLEQARTVAAGMGMDLETAIRVFLVQMVLRNGMPFRPSAGPVQSVKSITPLGTLFPISTTASTIFTKSITEASRHQLRSISLIYWRNLTREEFVGRNLILERVSYFMTNG